MGAMAIFYPVDQNLSKSSKSLLVMERGLCPRLLQKEASTVVVVGEGLVVVGAGVVARVEAENSFPTPRTPRTEFLYCLV